MSKDPSSKGAKTDAKKNSSPKGRDKPAKTGDERNYRNFEQNCLSRNIDKIHNFYLSNRDLFVYRTFRQVAGASSSTIINKLRGIPDLSVFQRMKTSTLSLMQPKMRFYKVTYVDTVEEPLGSGQYKVSPLPVPCYREFKFSDNFGYEVAASTEDYLAYESTKPTFRNVGLHSFSLESKGEINGPYEKNIFCQLKLSFKSLKDLEAQPPGEPPPSLGGLRYADLIIYPASKINSQTEQHNSKHYQIKAVIGWTAPSRQQLAGLNLSPKEITDISNLEKYNLMLSLQVLGYDISIKDDGQVLVTVKYKSYIEEATDSNTTNVFQDSIQVSSEGDLTQKCVSDNTLAKVSRIKTNVFNLVKEINEPSCSNDDTCAAKNKMIDLLNDDPFFAKCYGEAHGPGLASGGARETTDTEVIEVISGAGKRVKNREEVITWIKDKKNANTVLAVMKKRIGAFKKLIYQSFVDSLIDGDPVEQGGSGTRLFCFTAKRPEVEAALGIIPEPPKQGMVDVAKDADGEETIEEAGGSASVTEQDLIDSVSAAIGKDERSKAVIVGRCKDLQKKLVQIKEETAKETSEAIDQESEANDPKNNPKKEDKNKQSTISADTESHTFYFVFLGDIIELACRNAGLRFLPYSDKFKSKPFVFDRSCYVKSENNDGDIDYALAGLRLLLGPVEYYDSKEQLRRINLAQFPISFNYFRGWFLNKVVKRQATQMSLQDFLRRLMTELVLPAMGTALNEPIKAKNAKPSLINLTLPGQQTSGQKFKICGRNVYPFTEMLPQTPFIDTDGPSFNFNYYRKIMNMPSSETLVKTSYDYLLLQLSTIKDVTQREGNPVQDTRDGILHFSVGSDVGMVRSLDFKKVEQPFRAEQLHHEATVKGLDQLQQFKFPYNTHVKLVGVPFFTPGMRYYINPSLLGLGAIERSNSLAFQMNLGGYHIITNVKLSIQNGRFETTLSGYQEGHGKRGTK